MLTSPWQSHGRAPAGLTRVVVAVVLCAAAAVTGSASGAIAHPGAPLRTAAVATRAVFLPGKGLYDDKSASCNGFGVSVQGRYQHFKCILFRNDGLRSSVILHTTLSGLSRK